jgi:succinate dehydrogenase/fumarate reductase flavoprotein subunit
MLIQDARWKESADIVIAGYGGAGAVAAIAGHELGAEVLVLEKQASGHHYTNTQMSGGTVICSDDPAKVLGHMESLYRVNEGLTWTDRNILQVWSEYISQNKRWVEGLGGKIKLRTSGGEHHDIPGWDSIQIFQFAGSGLGMHRFLTSAAAQRNVRVLYEARAQKLLTDIRGRVVGVRVLTGREGRAVDIRARRGVVLTTGGFEFDESLKLNYLKVYPTYFYGTPANSGDGVRMAMEVGADLWHMNCCSARFVAKFPDFPIAFSLNFNGGRGPSHADKGAIPAGPTPAGYVVVDRSGKRFTSENIKAHTLYYELTVYDSQRCLYPRVPSFWIFDRRRMEMGPLPVEGGGPSGPVQLYRWELDNQNELEKGWIIQGKTVEELAEKIDIPAAALADTVRTYNSYCARGGDPEFHRRSSDLQPLDTPPFYAVRLYPGGPNTQGGPRRDSRARVLNTDGDPIPALYAAGELGSVYGMLYPSAGANLAECIAFGRLAAENAAREKF